MIKHGQIRGFKMKYPDGVGYTVEGVLSKDGDEEDIGGICFDFAEEEVDNLIRVLTDLKATEPELYVPDEKFEAYEAKQKILETRLWYKIYEKLNDIGIQFTPFEWRLTKLFITRTIPASSMTEEPLQVYRLCSGIYIGPICLTW